MLRHIRAGVAHFLPSVPGGWRSFERLSEIGGRFHFALLGVKVEPDLERFASLQPRRFAVALPQRNERRSAHGSDGAAVRVPVERDLNGGADFAKHALGIERQGNETHRTFPHYRDLEGFGNHQKDSFALFRKSTNEVNFAAEG
jgi:hypothetical protein